MVDESAAPGVGQAACWTRGRDPRATAGLLIGVIGLLAVVPACSSASTPMAVSTTSHPTTSTSAPSSVTFAQGSSAEIAACEGDAKVLDVALEAYMAENGAYPSPAEPWSAATYVANFQPLTSATRGGPYLHNLFATTDFVIEYDSAGHIWVAPPGAYGATYNPGQDFDTNPNVCSTAVR